jgi:hypothetical protein
MRVEVLRFFIFYQPKPKGMIGPVLCCVPIAMGGMAAGAIGGAPVRVGEMVGSLLNS